MNAPALLQMSGIVKSFGRVEALRGVDFSVIQGEVHALVGHNGAGKSTLVRLIAGVHHLDAGAITLHGRARHFAQPSDAIAAGIRLVSQERALVPELTAAENVLMGSLPSRHGIVDWRQVRTRAGALFETLGLDVNPSALVRDLRPAEKAMVEIAKALSEQAELLILDEPTATLSDHESKRLFAIIRQLQRRGAGIILVSHRVADIMSVATRVTVLRDGEVGFSSAVADIDDRMLITEMSGSDARSESPRPQPGVYGDVVLRVDDIAVEEQLAPVSFEVRAGEILGAYGLVGSGATDLPHAVVGDVRRTGRVTVLGREVTQPKDATTVGMGFVPADRPDGVVGGVTVRRNIGLASLSKYAPRGCFRHALERRAARRWVMHLSIQPIGTEVLTSTLSGGNQQKTLIGRWLERGVKVLVLTEPTRGVDIAARAAIHDELRRLAEAGVAVFIASSDLEEVLDVAHRVLVFAAGRVVAEFVGGRSSQEEALHAAAAS